MPCSRLRPYSIAILATFCLFFTGCEHLNHLEHFDGLARNGFSSPAPYRSPSPTFRGGPNFRGGSFGGPSLPGGRGPFRGADDIEKAIAIAITVRAVIEDVNARRIKQQNLNEFRGYTPERKVQTTNQTTRDLAAYNKNLNRTKTKLRKNSANTSSSAEDKKALNSVDTEITQVIKTTEKQESILRSEAKNLKSDPAKSKAMSQSADKLEAEIKELKVHKAEYAEMRNSGEF